MSTRRKMTLTLTLILAIFFGGEVYAFPEKPIRVNYWGPKKARVEQGKSVLLKVEAFDWDNPPIWPGRYDALKFMWIADLGRLRGPYNWVEEKEGNIIMYNSKVWWEATKDIRVCTNARITVLIDDCEFGLLEELLGVFRIRTDDAPVKKIFEVHVLPEPSTLFLLGSGLAGLIGLGRKRLIKKTKV